jgi:predicted metal-dependent enzyme (double-stranded beta helix superfamily)
MFEVARFAAACEAALADGGRDAVRGVLCSAVSDPAAIIAALGEPRRAGDRVLHRSQSLTILHIVWPPSFTQAPHNHGLWAEIGVYAGREDNIFWRRCGPEGRWPIEAIGAASLCAGHAHALSPDVIHSVTNPLDTVTAGLHIYGGDLSAASARRMWEGAALVEAPLDYRRDDRFIATYNASLAD